MAGNSKNDALQHSDHFRRLETEAEHVPNGQSDSHPAATNPSQSQITSVWGACILLIIVIVAAGTAQLIHSHRLTITTTTERANAKSFLIAEWIAKSFDLKQYVLQETVRHFQPEDLVYPPEDSKQHDRDTAMILDKVSRVPNLVFLGMLNSDCIVTHTSIGINLGFDAYETEREYCMLATSEPVAEFKVSNMFVSVDSTMNVTISFPMLSPEGQLDGFALAGLDLGFFQQWLDLIELEQESNVITIYDLNSRLLARKPLIQSSIGSRVEEERLNTMAATGSKELFSHRLVSPVDGIDRVWSLRRIHDLPFIVVVGEQTRTAMGTWRQQLLLYLIGGTILCLSIVIGTREYVRNLRQTAAMRQLAITDPLTGLANRRHFRDEVVKLLARSQRSGASLALIMADLDHFKHINDNFGHDTGDRVLREVAQVLNTLCRQGDLRARWGGEEFIILLPDTDLNGGTAFGYRLRQKISTIEAAPGHPVTLSQGLTLYQAKDNLDDLVRRADTALYKAKALGRDRIEVG